ncbi:MAG: thiosulfate sulfurtransferase GlpE [Myxococcales bacterium]|nr:thiosulfate sulfurtransferase GlpE [Myxococcales bacterium]
MATFKHISVPTLAADIAGGQSVVILDVRDPDSFSRGHIAGATRLHNANAATWVAQADKAAKTVVCCYHGHSSQGAAQFLAEQGFGDVYSLDGGMGQWAMSQACSQG